jgi:hypothetical protein
VIRGEPLADVRILQKEERIEAVMVNGRFARNRLQGRGRGTEMLEERRRA